MNPRKFLEVANELISGTREAEWRTAVSRAYYAAFHVAQEVLIACGFIVPDADRAHGYVWLRLANCGHVDVKNAGNELKQLRSVRNWADYTLNRDMYHSIALDQVTRAENIVAILDSVLGLPHVMVQITEAMKAYERDVLQDVTWSPTP